MPKKWLPSWPENMPRTLVFPEKTLPEFLSDHARQTPEKVAFNFYGREIPFREFDQRTNQLAMALMDFGLKKGDRVSLFLENSPQFVIGYFAILKAGGVVVAANPMFKEEELKYELMDAGARIIIAQDFLYPKVRNVREEAGLSHVILTSYRDTLPDSPSLPLHPSMQAPKERFPETLDLLEVMDSYRPEQVNIPIQPAGGFGFITIYFRHHRPSQRSDDYALQPNDQYGRFCRLEWCPGGRHSSFYFAFLPCHRDDPQHV